jgi:benzoate/toluate 1,2-dioxygenase subunit alpha
MTAMVEGGDAHAGLLPVTPARSVPSGSQLCDETLFHSYYRAWLGRLRKGLGA